MYILFKRKLIQIFLALEKKNYFKPFYFLFSFVICFDILFICSLKLQLLPSWPFWSHFLHFSPSIVMMRSSLNIFLNLFSSRQVVAPKPKTFPIVISGSIFYLFISAIFLLCSFLLSSWALFILSFSCIFATELN